MPAHTGTLRDSLEMHQLLLKRDIAELVGEEAGPCLSLYRTSREGGGEEIVGSRRFQGLLRQAESNLLAQGISAPIARAMLHRAMDASMPPRTDRPHGAGVAVFCSRQRLRAFHLPIGFVSRAVAADRFYLNPLLPWLYEGGHFHILTLHQNRSRLFHATRYSIGEIELEPPPPASPIHRVQRFAELQSSLRSGATDLRARPAPAGDKPPRELTEQISDINRHVRQRLDGDEAPLVLAGVGFLTSMFESIGGLSNVLEVKVPGSPDLWSEDELRSQAWRIVAEHNLRRQRTAITSYFEAEPSRRATEAPALLEAARRRRIAVLYVDRHLPPLSPRDQAAADVRPLLAESQLTNQSLQTLVSSTLAGGGDVLPVSSERIALGPAKVAALLMPD